MSQDVYLGLMSVIMFPRVMIWVLLWWLPPKKHGSHAREESPELTLLMQREGRCGSSAMAQRRILACGTEPPGMIMKVPEPGATTGSPEGGRSTRFRRSIERISHLEVAPCPVAGRIVISDRSGYGPLPFKALRRDHPNRGSRRLSVYKS